MRLALIVTGTIAALWIAGAIATTHAFTRILHEAPVDGAWWTGDDDTELEKLLTEGAV